MIFDLLLLFSVAALLASPIVLDRISNPERLSNPDRWSTRHHWDTHRYRRMTS